MIGDEVMFAADGCAEGAGVDILFEGAVAGGIPIIRPMKESLAGDKVYLRAQSRVRQTTKSKRSFATYTLIQGVALK